MNMFRAWLEKQYDICFHQNIIEGGIETRDLKEELAEVRIVCDYLDVFSRVAGTTSLPKD